MEIKTQSEVNAENHHLEVKRLKAQMRTICDNQSLTDVFATFEDNVARLVRENEALRQMNLQLEAKELDAYLRAQEKSLFPAAAPGANKSNSGGVEHGSEEGGGETFRLQTAKKENLRLVSRLKKSGQDREILKSSFEELKAKERHFIVNTKIANDTARRLRATHQELIRTRRELEEQTALREIAERDLRLVREDTQVLRDSEAGLREERSRYLSDLAKMRERVREVDHESRRIAQLNRFVHKHSGAPTATPSGGGGGVGRLSSGLAVPAPGQAHQAQPPQQPQSMRHAPTSATAGRSSVSSSTESLDKHHQQHHQQTQKTAPPLPFQAYRAHIASVLSRGSSQPRNNISPPRSSTNQQHQLSVFEETKHVDTTPVDYSRHHPLPQGTVGQAGLSNAQYLRIEESDGIEPTLEVSLTAMHESLIATQPTLLPLFRKLTSEIHSERTRALQKRSQLLNLVAPHQYDHKDDSEKLAPSQQRSNATSYANLLKNQQGQHNYSGSYEEKVNAAQSTRGTKKSVRF